MNNKAKILRQCGNKISRTELLAALAEECIELAHASLKYRRSLTQDNPTPVDEGTAWKDVEEEISDVMNILVSGYFVNPESTVESICSEDKAYRWMQRLNDKVYPPKMSSEQDNSVFYPFTGLIAEPTYDSESKVNFVFKDLTDFDKTSDEGYFSVGGTI